MTDIANGKLVHSQDITENVTAIDAEAWAEPVHSLITKKQAEANFGLRLSFLRR